MSDTQAKLPAIEEELLPTPQVGTMVYWYDRNEVNEESKRPAMIIKREGPGRVSLKVFRMGDDIHKQGCCHVDHPIHQQRNAHSTVHNGSFAYMCDKNKIPAGDYDLAKDERDRRIAAEQELQAQLKEASAKKLGRMVKS